MKKKKKKESACNAGEPGWSPGSGRSAAEEIGYPLQYSGLENSMDCIVHGVARSQTRLSDFHFLWYYIHNDHKVLPVDMNKSRGLFRPI